MKWEMQLLYLLLLLIFYCPTSTYSKSVIEPCNDSDPCTSFLSYRLPWDSKFSEIAFRFQLNVTDILASNSIDLTNPPFFNQILPKNSVVKLPISCPCTDGIRRSLSTLYSVEAADTMESISESYGSLVSAEQLKSVNGISGENHLDNRDSLVIPLPCTCFNNSNYGAAAVYMSYVVQAGERLSSIAAVYGTTITNLETVNGLGQPQIDAGDILAIPLPACSSANLNWYNESLIVPSGSCALTANDCIKCSCRPANLNLQCSPSGLIASCSHLQCKGSDLFIGDAIENQTANGCNVSACVYRGHSDRKIHRSLVNSTSVHCTGNQSHAMSPSMDDNVPFLTLSPSPSPSSYSVSNGPVGIFGADHPAGRDTAKSSTPRKLIKEASAGFCLLLEIAFFLLFYIYFSF